MWNVLLPHLMEEERALSASHTNIHVLGPILVISQLWSKVHVLHEIRPFKEFPKVTRAFNHHIVKVTFQSLLQYLS